MKVLLTSTSFQDTPGPHQTLLSDQGWDVSTLRGPLPESEILPIIAEYDALICGDDELTEKVLKTGLEGNLKYISKYGVGLDKIDLDAAKKLGIPVTNCPGVNQVSVAEHVLALLFTFFKNVHLEHIVTSNGGWKRHVGTELFGKTIGIVGLGAIGKELSTRAKALGLSVKVFDISIDEAFCAEHGLQVANSLDSLLKDSDIVSLHLPLLESTQGMISRDRMENQFKPGAVLVNTSRGGLVDSNALIDQLEKGHLGGYLADVLEIEPMAADEPLKGLDNVLITPHIGSRTYESVQRQGSMAVNNLIKMISSNDN